MTTQPKYKGWNFIEQKWEDVTKEVYDTLLDPARCIVPVSREEVSKEDAELQAIFCYPIIDEQDFDDTYMTYDEYVERQEEKIGIFISGYLSAQQFAAQSKGEE